MTMPQETSSPDKPLNGTDEGPVHPLQRFLDNPWLLLMLGFLIPFLSYTVWGWVELLMIKKAELP
ncbi:MAG: hypothetical protein KF754_01175 [Planctomycetes bacterium]|nr:hypothetical protein [Planctomycetota bacterium]